MIIADAGPLIAISLLEQYELLLKLYQEVIITEAVLAECLFDKNLPGAEKIGALIQAKKINIKNPKPSQIELSHCLGDGEASSILLAKQSNEILLVDDKLARKTAKQLDINIIGVPGLLLAGKGCKHFKKIKPLLNQLKENGYYISSALEKFLLETAKE